MYAAIALVSPEIYFNVLHTVLNNLIELQLYTANAAAFQNFININNPIVKLICFLIMSKYTLADRNMWLSSSVPGLVNAARKLV